MKCQPYRAKGLVRLVSVLLSMVVVMKRCFFYLGLVTIGAVVVGFCHQFLVFDGYLSRFELRHMVLDIPPPPRDSAEGRRDRKIFQNTRVLKDGERWWQAIVDNDDKLDILLARFARVSGHVVTRQTTPALFTFFDKIVQDGDRALSRSKKKYRRLRPFRQIPMPICAKGLKSYDYPSGHATRGWLIAFVLADMKPMAQEALFETARQFGESRVICGVHHASSVEIAESYAGIIKNKLYSKTAFVADFARAKQELLSAPDFLTGKLPKKMSIHIK